MLGNLTVCTKCRQKRLSLKKKKDVSDTMRRMEESA